MKRRWYTQLQARCKDISQVFLLPGVPWTKKLSMEAGTHGLSGCCVLMETGCGWVVAWWPSTLPPKTALCYFWPIPTNTEENSLGISPELLLPSSAWIPEWDQHQFLHQKTRNIRRQCELSTPNIGFMVHAHIWESVAVDLSKIQKKTPDQPDEYKKA